jgi:hypothetical protein
MNTTNSDCFVTSKAQILHELLRSKAEGNALGIWSASLGSGMFLCTVKEVCTDEDEEDIMIILKENELTAPRMDTHVVYLYEIERVYTFKTTPAKERTARL